MTVLKAHFDGKVFVPDEPVNLPLNCALELHVRLSPPNGQKPALSENQPLMRLVELLEELPDSPDTPTDGAAQHDHYLFGLPKRP